jgi:hypothetical protein
MSNVEMENVLADAREWNELRARWHREWLHEVAVEMAAAFEGA